jgi:hypothetical protein
MTLLSIIMGSGLTRVLPEGLVQSLEAQSGAPLEQVVDVTSSAWDDTLGQIQRLMQEVVAKAQQEGAPPEGPAASVLWPSFFSEKRIIAYIEGDRTITPQDKGLAGFILSGTPAAAVPSAKGPTATPAKAPVDTVWPALEFVADNGDGTFTAYFGYDNRNATAVTIPVGPDNGFSPEPFNRGQPTVFKPGVSTPYPKSAFRVVFPGGKLTWSLNGHTVTALVSAPTQ